LRATIITHHAGVSAARSIEASLKADNKAAPAPLRISSRVIGTCLTSTITGAQDIESLLTTIDDLLLCLIAADTVLSTVERKRSKARAID
jgi:hypothetical protein